MFVWNLFFAVLFSFGCKLAVVGLSNDGLGVRNELKVKRIVKRHDLDYPTCLNSFDIHQDKIIRTQDSRAMGAKYLNERDVTSREDCLRLCCETRDCDVFVFEEKSPGSCYLFQCGSPEDFKCKFTKHRNYTSAVLSSNRHMTELESQIKLTQHEHELTKLRMPDLLSSTATLAPPVESTTVPQGSKEVAQVIPTSSNTEAEILNRRCSRYQFECRNSGECIAIYNACDGIPQCSDGSDEAPELGCPAQVVSTQPPLAKSNPAPGENIAVVPSMTHKLVPAVTLHNLGSLQQPSVNQQLPSTSLAEDNQLTMPVLSKQYKSNQWTQQMYNAALESQHGGNPNYPNPGQQNALPMSMNQQLDLQVQNQQMQDLQQPSPQLVNQAKIYGREGEGLLYRPGSELLQWPSYQQEQSNPGPYHSASNGNSQIFSHKGNGLVSQTDRYRHSMNHEVARGGGGNNGQYEPLQNDFTRYNNNNYYENSPPYRGMQQGQLPNNWQNVRKPHEINSLNNMEENMNFQGANMPQNVPLSAPGQDYYYEESFRTRVQPQMIPQRIASHSQPVANVEIPKEKLNTVQQTETLPAIHESTNSHSEGVSVKKQEVHHSVNINTTTEKPKEITHDHHHSSHRKMEQLTAELTLSESNFDSDIDQQNVSPRGAILSLTMGMCVTGIMLVLVGCRMRMVRRRLRRGSKSPYAHDADFLVNGMYL